MDLIDPILSIATTLYTLYQDVKANKKRCKRVMDRVKGLEQVLRATKQKGDPQVSTEVNRALEELKLTLESATGVIKKYTSDREDLIKRFVNTYNHGDEFESLNDRLNDAFQTLSLNLQVEMDRNLRKLFQASSQREEDEADRKDDCAEIQKMLQHIVSNQDTMMEKMDALTVNMDAMKVERNIELLQRSENIPKDIRQIIPGDLIFDFPKTPIITTDISEVYKGEYRNYPVAIKKYLCQKATMSSEVVKVFEKEIKDMICYESPYILRMFGVCFQGADGLIVMEYCELGSLREVLDNHKKLSWSRKARMCLDAAQGIYRLHQSEAKSKVHGAVSSDKFMVDEGYRVKLGGLELAQTETSLRKNCKNPESALRYRAPEQLGCINHPYCKICEIYSLGMVLWEIATRQKPLADCTRDLDVFKRVCKEKRVLEPLPDDCPKMLGDLINACRAFDPFQRPTAGVLVDKLRNVRMLVENLNEE